MSLPNSSLCLAIAYDIFGMSPSDHFPIGHLLDIASRSILYTTKGQPFLIAGSGTLGWDQVAANLVGTSLCPADAVCGLSSHFARFRTRRKHPCPSYRYSRLVHAMSECQAKSLKHRLLWRQFRRCVRFSYSPPWRITAAYVSIFSLETYGAKVDQLKAEIGTTVIEAEVENALLSKKYKILTFTHVDTSYVRCSIPLEQASHNGYLRTGVLSNAKRIAETVRRVSPDTLVRQATYYIVSSFEFQTGGIRWCMLCGERRDSL